MYSQGGIQPKMSFVMEDDEEEEASFGEDDEIVEEQGDALTAAKARNRVAARAAPTNVDWEWVDSMGEEHGPISFTSLRALYHQGEELTPDSRVRPEGMRWRPVSDVADLIKPLAENELDLLHMEPEERSGVGPLKGTGIYLKKGEYHILETLVNEPMYCSHFALAMSKNLQVYVQQYLKSHVDETFLRHSRKLGSLNTTYIQKYIDCFAQRPDEAVEVSKQASDVSVASSRKSKKNADDGAFLYIVSEICQGDSLADWIMSHKGEPSFTKEPAVRAIIEQITLGLVAAHGHDMLHGDLSPANIILDKSAIKIVGFENRFLLKQKEMFERTNFLYNAPERVRDQDNGYDVQSDLWSLGIIMFQMLFDGLTPYHYIFGDSDQQIAENDMREYVRLFLSDRQQRFDCNKWKWLSIETLCEVKGYNQDAASLLRALLQKDPAHRITSKMIMEHGFLSTAFGGRASMDSRQSAGPVVSPYLAGRSTPGFGRTTSSKKSATSKSMDLPSGGTFLADPMSVYTIGNGRGTAFRPYMDSEALLMEENSILYPYKLIDQRKHPTWFDETAVAHGRSSRVSNAGRRSVSPTMLRKKLQTSMKRIPQMHCVRTMASHNNFVYCIKAYKTVNRGITLFTGGVDCTIKVWDTYNQKYGASGDSTLYGHSGPVTDLAVSNSRLLSSSADGTIKIWDMKYYNCMGTFPDAHSKDGHKGKVWALACYDKGRRMASCSSDNTIKVWNTSNLKTPRCLHTLRPAGNKTVRDIDTNTDLNAIVSGSKNGDLVLWGMNGEHVRKTSSLRDLWCVSFIENHIIANGTGEGKVQLWGNDLRRCYHVIDAHENNVFRCRYDPNLRLLYTGGADGVVRIWDLRMLSEVGKVPKGGAEDAKPVGLEAVGKTALLQELRGHKDGVLGMDVCYSRLWTASKDRTVKEWDRDY